MFRLKQEQTRFESSFTETKRDRDDQICVDIHDLCVSDFFLSQWLRGINVFFRLRLHHRRFTDGDTLLGEAGGNVLLYKSCGRAKAVWSRSGDGQIKISSDWSLAFVLPALKDSLGFERRLSSIFPLLVMCGLRHLALIVNTDQWHVLSLPSCLSHFSPGNMAVL